MNKNIISLIIPVYNSEQYLVKMLNSVCNQTIFQFLEVILIDDGSTDDSIIICKKYQDRYSNIKVVTQDNRGVSAARNLGLEIAKGEYVTFLDSDDYVEPDLYEKELRLIQKHNSDIVVVDFHKIHTDGRKIKYRKNYQLEWNDTEDALKSFFSGIIGNQVVDKLFKRVLLNDVRFCPEYKIGEDMKFVYDVLTKSRNVIMDTSICGYKYIVREGSAMTGFFSEKYFDPVKISLLMFSDLEHNPRIQEYAKAHLVHESCKVMEYVLRHDAIAQSKEKYEEIQEIINSYSVIKAMKYLVLKQFCGFILMKYNPRLYLTIHKIMRIG